MSQLDKHKELARTIAQDIVDVFHPMDDVPAGIIADAAVPIISVALAATEARVRREGAEKLALEIEIMQATGTPWPIRTADKIEAISDILASGDTVK